MRALAPVEINIFFAVKKMVPVVIGGVRRHLFKTRMNTKQHE
jgi:hypothetical protein